MTIHKRKQQGRNDVERGETRRTLKLLFISIPTNYFSLEQFYLWTFSKSSNASPVSNLLKRQSLSFTWPVAMQIFGTNYLTEKRV